MSWPENKPKLQSGNDATECKSEASVCKTAAGEGERVAKERCLACLYDCKSEWVGVCVCTCVTTQSVTLGRSSSLVVW